MNRPSVKKQKVFILNNCQYISHQNKIDILNIVDISEEEKKDIIFEKNGTKELCINMDKCSEDTIWNIYQIVTNRLNFLNNPSF